MLDELKQKILTLSEKAWERKIDWPEVESWLSNFDGEFEPKDRERLHALYLLTQSMYFGQSLIREMLRSIYEHLYRYPIIKEIRKKHNDTLDAELIEGEFSSELNNTRFLGVGNPSESGPHLLYYFRQINDIQKSIFIDSGQILGITRDENGISISQSEPDVKHYIFIDDVLGSGTQITTYLWDILRELRRCAPDVEISYYALFATSDGLSAARAPELFGDNVGCIYELDNTFKCFDNDSRYFSNDSGEIDKAVAKTVAEGYGEKLWHKHPLGYKNGQLLLALAHNTPDNSLPILWVDVPKNIPWHPIFRRFHKKYL